MNVAVAKSLHDYCVKYEVTAREVEGYPITFSVGPKLLCWSPALFIYPDRITVPFIDLRRSYDLHREAQRFLFSTQNEALRVINPDYADVQFEILKFLNDDTRTVSVVSEAGYRLFTYEQLEEMIVFTQLLWIEVVEERVTKKRGSGRKGPDDLL